MISFLSHYHKEKSTDRGLPGETSPWGEILRPQNTGWVGASTSERASFLPSFSFLHATLFLLTSSLPELVRIASLTMFPFFFPRGRSAVAGCCVFSTWRPRICPGCARALICGGVQLVLGLRKVPDSAEPGVQPGESTSRAGDVPFCVARAFYARWGAPLPAASVLGLHTSSGGG